MGGRNMTKKEGRISMIFPSFLYAILCANLDAETLFSAVFRVRSGAAVCDAVRRLNVL